MCMNNSPKISLQEDGRITDSDEIGDISPNRFSFNKTTTISYCVFVYLQRSFDRAINIARDNITYFSGPNHQAMSILKEENREGEFEDRRKIHLRSQFNIR